MNRGTISGAILVILLLTAGFSLASSKVIETRDLIVSDATGKLSDEQLRGQADQAQKLLGRILAFWSEDAAVNRLDKIRVVFDDPRREISSSVFFWGEKDGRRIRIVQVFKSAGEPQMMAHKLTSAVFPQKDKLIRNLMGILSETQLGNTLTFPMCGYSSDEWVSAFRKGKLYIPLNELGPDHESWGMRDAGGGKLLVLDKARQHRAYAETGSFGNYLFKTYGIDRIKRLHRLSREKERPWQEVFGLDLDALESDWLEYLVTNEDAGKEHVPTLAELLAGTPDTACLEAQKLASGKD